MDKGNDFPVNKKELFVVDVIFELLSECHQYSSVYPHHGLRRVTYYVDVIAQKFHRPYSPSSLINNREIFTPLKWTADDIEAGG